MNTETETLVGHNSGEIIDMPSEPIAKERLRGIIEKLEQLDLERAALAGDMREILSEAKKAGFDTKVIRELIKSRRVDPSDYDQMRLILDLYRDAMD